MRPSATFNKIIDEGRTLGTCGVAAIEPSACVAAVALLATLRRCERRRAFRAQERPAAPAVWALAGARKPAITRSPILAVGGMAGLDILRMGGNAIDAAIAVAATLARLLHAPYAGASRAVASLNGSGCALGALTLARARADCALAADALTLPSVHAYTVTVPGAVAAWFDAEEALGSGLVSMRTLLQPAIQLAERGFPVSPITAHYWREDEALLREASANGGELLDANGRAPEPGALVRRCELASVLRLVAEQGREGFYAGRVADAIAQAVHDAGGCLARSDLHAHCSTFTEAISAPFHGVQVWEHPPNGGGLPVLLALNILRVLEEQGRVPPLNASDAVAQHDSSDASGSVECCARGVGELPVEREVQLLHAQIEALRLAYAFTAYYIGDPAAEEVPVGQLLSLAFARKRASHFSSLRAMADTVSWQVVDGEGNAVSGVQSNYLGFSTGIVPKGCGFTLQIRGLNFSTRAGEPNSLAPGKRPFHTILPCLLTDAATGELVASLTNMGGFMQPQGHVQPICRLVSRGLCPQLAVDLPRFCLQPLHPGTAPCSPVVAVEAGFRPEVVAGLCELGHTVQVCDGYGRYCFGRAQVNVRVSSGALWGGSDGQCAGLHA
ncbi:nucleophile aminohydrolase [Pavlovales sp. CCMP2436]|nr:nucleophile aminohydrolase [Pavlovales sp. CCMP2436]